MYSRYAAKSGLKTEILYAEYGKASLLITGTNATSLFKHEKGKHIVQRYPPTENKGRRHTSVVCVAVLPLPENNTLTLNESDLDIQTKRGSGPGGQHRNKTESCVSILHKPTGIRVTIDSRDQHANKKEAKRILAARVKELGEHESHLKHSTAKRQQMDGGGRSNKTRTYNFIDSRVTDHILGTKTSKIDKIMKGHLELILEQ
jgi:peptide chain release factor 1